ncbi:MAG: DNA-binding YbaB/EbfC family protein [Myxococcota bacterium]|jgi:DNA-binding YbaB/EbfC family protein
MNMDDLMKGGNLQGLMQQAQEMQQKMAEAQSRAELQSAQGEAAGGLVKVTANGKLEILAVAIDPAIGTEDLEMLQDLIVAATNDAIRKAREVVTNELGPLAQMLKGSGLGGL